MLDLGEKREEEKGEKNRGRSFYTRPIGAGDLGE